MEHATSTIKTIYGKSKLHCFSFGPHEEQNLLVIEAGEYRKSKIVRLQSACYTSEIFRSTDCDCHEQLHSALARIHNEGGLLIYMLCDGRGAGLLTKIKGLSLGLTDGLDTYDAYAKLGVSADPREYGQAAEVLRYFKLTEIKLLTNNPRKILGLSKLGINASRMAHEFPATADSCRYLMTKKEKGGHLLSEEIFPDKKPK